MHTGLRYEIGPIRPPSEAYSLLVVPIMRSSSASERF
jgi:hypothetical protein